MVTRHEASGHPALDALARAVEAAPLPEGRVLFLRAAPSDRLEAIAARTECVAWLKDDADRLDQAGWRRVEAPEGRYAAALVLAGRDRAEARGLLAVAVAGTLPEGVVLAAATNLDGAPSLGRDLEALAGPPVSYSKHKCRVFRRAVERTHVDMTLLADWATLSRPVEVRPGFVSQPGLFGWDRIDRGSALLARHLPEGLGGAAVDLGCGPGFLAVELLERNPGLRRLDLVDLDRRALAAAKANLAALSGPTRIETHWADVTLGLGPARFGGPVDLVVTNPPFHRTRAAEPGIGQAFIAAAHAILKPGGRLILVANRALPYEAPMERLFASRRTLEEAEGYKVLEAVK